MSAKHNAGWWWRMESTGRIISKGHWWDNDNEWSACGGMRWPGKQSMGQPDVTRRDIKQCHHCVRMVQRPVKR